MLIFNVSISLDAGQELSNADSVFKVILITMLANKILAIQKSAIFS